jgi:Sec-independent protein secretion pathway component TatC
VSKKPFFDHFKELNIRILFSLVFFLIISGIVYANYSTIYDFLISPLLNAGYSNTDLVAFTIYEGFQVKITNTFLVSFILILACTNNCYW